MKSNTNAPKNNTKTGIKWPYSESETNYLKELILSGLFSLQDVWKKVNYEECCRSIIDSIPENIIASEFVLYWKYWITQFQAKKWRKSRTKVFEALILDLKNKWLMSSNAAGLTGNYSTLIMDLLSDNPTD
jgi:hypothetical protein